MDDAWAFLSDLQGRLANRVQLTTDGLRAYQQAADLAFGDEIDYAMLNKLYGLPEGLTRQERRYSTPVCTGIEVRTFKGDPDPSEISTSYVERQNLTMRMGMRRFTRLTNGLSKKVENLAHAVSLHYTHYNFARVHQSLTITNDDGSRTKRTRRWRLAWPITFGRCARSRRCSIQTDPLPTARIRIVPDLRCGVATVSGCSGTLSAQLDGARVVGDPRAAACH